MHLPLLGTFPVVQSGAVPADRWLGTLTVRHVIVPHATTLAFLAKTTFFQNAPITIRNGLTLQNSAIIRIAHVGADGNIDGDSITRTAVHPGQFRHKAAELQYADGCMNASLLHPSSDISWRWRGCPVCPTEEIL